MDGNDVSHLGRFEEFFPFRNPIGFESVKQEEMNVEIPHVDEKIYWT
jgi:hypothetical protein